MLSPGQEQEWAAWWRKVISGRSTGPKELKITGAHGRQIWMEVISLLVKDPHGRAQVQSISRDVTSRRQSEQRRAEQQKTLELIATGAPLTEILGQLIQLIEAESSGVIGSIFLLDSAGTTLRLGLAPHLPTDFSSAVDGIQISEGRGACATAVARNCDVIVDNFETIRSARKGEPSPQNTGSKHAGPRRYSPDPARFWDLCRLLSEPSPSHGG